MNPRFGLAQRLLWLGAITTVLVLGVSGFVLRDRLHDTILRSLAASLNERADRISARSGSIASAASSTNRQVPSSCRSLSRSTSAVARARSRKPRRARSPSVVTSRTGSG